MLRHVVVAAAVTGALTLFAPPAAADHHLSGCGLRSLQQEDVTGANYEGVAYGYVVGDSDDAVGVHCELQVNGAVVDTTPAGTGTAVAHSAGRVVYAAGDYDVVELCAVVTVDGAASRDCRELTVTQIPPQWVYDALCCWGPGPDPWFTCWAFQQVAGTYGPVYVNEQGDVYVAGEPQWDCPPYDIWPSE